jgi:hypothetical protein
MIGSGGRSSRGKAADAEPFGNCRLLSAHRLRLMLLLKQDPAVTPTEMNERRTLAAPGARGYRKAQMMS